MCELDTNFISAVPPVEDIVSQPNEEDEYLKDKPQAFEDFGVGFTRQSSYHNIDAGA